ncbi:hypothetical protein SEVIR_1G194401v4 [Setaria viridis]
MTATNACTPIDSIPPIAPSPPDRACSMPITSKPDGASPPRFSMSPPAFLPPASPRKLHASHSANQIPSQPNRGKEGEKKQNQIAIAGEITCLNMRDQDSGMRTNRNPRHEVGPSVPPSPQSSHRSCDLGHLFQARSQRGAMPIASQTLRLRYVSRYLDQAARVHYPHRRLARVQGWLVRLRASSAGSVRARSIWKKATRLSSAAVLQQCPFAGLLPLIVKEIAA